MNSVKKFVPNWSLRTMYYGYVHSIIDYGLILWGPMCSKAALKSLSVQQNKAVRIIESAAYNSHVTPYYHKWHILKLDDQINLNLVKFTYKYARNEHPIMIMNLFRSGTIVHSYSTRSRHLPMIETHKTSYFNNSFLRKSSSVFNELSNKMKQSKTMHSFARSFIESKLQAYKSVK